MACFRSDLLRFIERHIHSVEQLEVLLLLRRDDKQTWSVEQVSRELRTNPSSAEVRLQDLQSRGFAKGEKEGDAMYFSYLRGSTETELLIAELTEAYRIKRIALIEVIFDKPKNHLQDFAQAFQVGKKEND